MVNIKEKLGGERIFLMIAILIFLITILLKTDILIPSINYFYQIIKKIIPILIIVFVLMVISNYFINPTKLSTFFSKKKNIKAWITTVFAGIISTGPIYMWYPLLRDLRDKGVKQGFMATFLYNRAIKMPLLPLMITYFSLKFIIVLLGVMIFMSIIQGLIINKLMEV
ncbi:hypothetical protein K8R33_05020 [archaeon]|nr:hypothetical protein [archaeon]